MSEAIRWIENVSKDAVTLGLHSDLGINTMLIRIQDPATEFVEPKKEFRETYQFEFLDSEDSDPEHEDAKISDYQAARLVGLLQRALDKHMNVLVHCHAGICRSGAVVEVATMMGFTATDRHRQPNLRVKHKMMKELGFYYD